MKPDKKLLFERMSIMNPDFKINEGVVEDYNVNALAKEYINNYVKDDDVLYNLLIRKVDNNLDEKYGGNIIYLVANYYDRQLDKTNFFSDSGLLKKIYDDLKEKSGDDAFDKEMSDAYFDISDEYSLELKRRLARDFNQKNPLTPITKLFHIIDDLEYIYNSDEFKKKVQDDKTKKQEEYNASVAWENQYKPRLKRLLGMIDYVIKDFPYYGYTVNDKRLFNAKRRIENILPNEKGNEEINTEAKKLVYYVPIVLNEIIADFNNSLGNKLRYTVPKKGDVILSLSKDGVYHLRKIEQIEQDPEIASNRTRFGQDYFDDKGEVVTPKIWDTDELGDYYVKSKFIEPLNRDLRSSFVNGRDKLDNESVVLIFSTDKGEVMKEKSRAGAYLKQIWRHANLK